MIEPRSLSSRLRPILSITFVFNRSGELSSDGSLGFLSDLDRSGDRGALSPLLIKPVSISMTFSILPILPLISDCLIQC